MIHHGRAYLLLWDENIVNGNVDTQTTLYYKFIS